MDKFQKMLQRRAEIVEDIQSDLNWAKYTRKLAIGILAADVLLVSGGGIDLIEAGVAVGSIGVIVFESIYIPVAEQESKSRQA